MENKKCVFCDKSFTPHRLIDNRANRGKFCSISCAAKFNNSKRVDFEKKCVLCNSLYLTKSKHSKYCSDKCKDSKRNNVKNKSRNHLNAKIKALLEDTSCFSCGWNLDVCDTHHIIHKSKGGTDELDNLSILCPNCHRLAHKDKLKDIISIKDKLNK